MTLVAQEPDASLRDLERALTERTQLSFGADGVQAIEGALALVARLTEREFTSEFASQVGLAMQSSRGLKEQDRCSARDLMEVGATLELLGGTVRALAELAERRSRVEVTRTLDTLIQSGRPPSNAGSPGAQDALRALSDRANRAAQICAEEPSVRPRGAMATVHFECEKLNAAVLARITPQKPSPLGDAAAGTVVWFEQIAQHMTQLLHAHEQHAAALAAQNAPARAIKAPSVPPPAVTQEAHPAAGAVKEPPPGVPLTTTRRGDIRERRMTANGDEFRALAELEAMQSFFEANELGPVNDLRRSMNERKESTAGQWIAVLNVVDARAELAVEANHRLIQGIILQFLRDRWGIEEKNLKRMEVADVPREWLDPRHSKLDPNKKIARVVQRCLLGQGFRQGAMLELEDKP